MRLGRGCDAPARTSARINPKIRISKTSMVGGYASRNLKESGLGSLIARSSAGIASPLTVVASAGATDMQYRILGPFAVTKDGVEVVMGSGKQRALLALLLLHANEPVSTDRLIDQLWGESRSTSATKVLHNYVSKLRRLLGEGVLITRGRAYELRVEPGELDLDRFNDQVADGRHALAAGDPAHAADALGEASPSGTARRWPTSPTISSRWRRSSTSTVYGLRRWSSGSRRTSSSAVTAP